MSKGFKFLGIDWDGPVDLARGIFGGLLLLVVASGIMLAIVGGVIDLFTPEKDTDVTQSYWYCWDTGDPSPHHLGHYVDNDHYCSVGELRAAGK